MLRGSATSGWSPTWSTGWLRCAARGPIRGSARGLPTLRQGAFPRAAVHVRHFDAERGRQVDLMILLLGENLADLLCQRVFSKRLALADSIAIIANGLVLVIEVEPEHLFRIFRGAYRLRGDHRHFAEIVDLPREDQGVI